mmetsp:Transcript_39045/g.76318  ORF Transcript_39045/g.76318 Transcript_39045/m.76318 type:complete len:284 (+) Transcript_39045:262-1113(+)
MIKVFRSVWGLPEVRGVKQVVAALQRGGFQGVEASLGDVDAIEGKENRGQWRDALAEAGLLHVAGLYTSWQDYEGAWEDLAVSEHLGRWREQLEQAKELSPWHINAHSGQDSWGGDEQNDFFAQALASQEKAGLACGISHETHRGRILNNPWTAERLLQRHPDLLLTGDFSHWFLVSERLLQDSERERQMWNVVLPRTVHVHARVGGEQRPQYDACETSEERRAQRVLDNLLLEVWAARRAAGSSWVSVTPEYGPMPYSNSLLDTSVLVQREAERLRALFASW